AITAAGTRSVGPVTASCPSGSLEAVSTSTGAGMVQAVVVTTSPTCVHSARGMIVQDGSPVRYAASHVLVVDVTTPSTHPVVVVSSMILYPSCSGGQSSSHPDATDDQYRMPVSPITYPSGTYASTCVVPPTGSGVLMYDHTSDRSGSI